MDGSALITAVFGGSYLALSGALLIVGLLLGRGADVLSEVRGRLVSAVGVLLLVLAGSAALDGEWSGVLYTVAVPVSAAVGLLWFGLPPWRDPVRTGARSASLHRRTLLGLVGHGEAIAAVVVLLVAVVVIGLCIPLSGPDGHSFTVSYDGGAFTATQYPGFVLGPSMLLGLLGLAVATLVALRRAVRLPELFVNGIEDRRWRRRAMRTVLALAVGATLFQLAFVLFSLGTAFGSAQSHGLAIAGAAAQLAAPLVLLGAIGLLSGSLVLAALVGLARSRTLLPAPDAS